MKFYKCSVIIMKWTKSFYCEHNIYFFLLQNFGQNLWRKLLRKKNIFPKYCFHNDNISGQSWAFRVNIVEEIYCELNEEIFDILSFYYDKWKFVWSKDERNQAYTDETIVYVYWNSINLYWNWEIMRSTTIKFSNDSVAFWWNRITSTV